MQYAAEKCRTVPGYITPFTQFVVPGESDLLESWKKHFKNLKIRFKVISRGKYRELIINERDHTRELMRVPVKEER